MRFAVPAIFRLSKGDAATQISRPLARVTIATEET